MEIKKLFERYNSDKEKLEAFGKSLSNYLKVEITKKGVLPEISFRVKEFLSIVKKIKKGSTSDIPITYESLTDIFGMRIICTYQHEIDVIRNVLASNLRIIKEDNKMDNLKANELNYLSYHFDVKLEAGSVYDDKKIPDVDIVFEIQVRTLNQHAWSNAAHTLLYKNEVKLEEKFKRRIFRLLSLYEIADDELSSVDEYIKTQDIYKSYSILKKIEKYIFMYAQVDYDRELSIIMLNNILSDIPAQYLQRINDNIIEFIDTNKSKISKIFEENRHRFEEIYFLTQPEIFVIWFLFSNNLAAGLDENWSKHSDNNDLNDIKLLWGSNL